MYSSGGWKIRPGSCSSGFRSRPSSAAGSSRSNGLEVSSTNSSRPVATRPSTPSTRATMVSSSVREQLRDRHRPARQHEDPQQQRAFMAAPHRGQPVRRGQQRVGMPGDIGDREIVDVEAPGQRGERSRDQQEHDLRGRPRQHQPFAPAAGARPAAAACPARRPRTAARIRAKCPSSAIMAWPPPSRSLGLVQRVLRCRRHVVLVVLGQHLGGGEVAVRRPACPAPRRLCPP